jgi:hypothetical protein
LIFTVEREKRGREGAPCISFKCSRDANTESKIGEVKEGEEKEERRDRKKKRAREREREREQNLYVYYMYEYIIKSSVLFVGHFSGAARRLVIIAIVSRMIRNLYD